MSLGKRFGPEQDQRHPGHLEWPGTPDGIPVLGPAGLTKSAELSQIEYRGFYRAQFFNMWDPADVQHYTWVMERSLPGWFKIYDRQKVWDAEHKSYRIWLEWSQNYGMPPRRNPE